MYIPKHFREDRLDVLHRIIEDESFATLVTSTPDGIIATHIPFLLDRSRGPLGTLRGHVARANPHWQHLTNGTETLVIFLGPHAYVSPTWYGSGGRVPTWNYLAVHAYGTPEPFDDVLDPAAVSGLLSGIVGFEIPIARIEGKRKLGQNRSRPEREGMVRGLRAQGRDDAAVIADLVEADLAGS